jgi:glycosyltransferase involved in cell wall biosynthesis
LKIAILHFEETSRPGNGYKAYLLNLSRSLIQKGHRVDTLNLFGTASAAHLWGDRLKRTRYSAYLLAHAARLGGYDIVLFTEPLYPHNLLLLRYLRLCCRACIVLWLWMPRISQEAYYTLIKKDFPALITAEIARPFAEKLATRVEILLPAVDIGRMCPRDVDKKWDFLYLGHLAREKGVILLLQAMKIIKANNMPCNLKIVHTPGKEEGAVRRFIAENGLDKVEIEMAVTDNHAAIYSSARVFVYPGIAYHRVVDTPLTIIEASACGLPVVTTSLYRHIALPNLTYCETDPELLAAAMLRALGSWDSLQQARALSVIQECHSLESLGNRAEAYFRGLLKGRH